ncbi:MAG: Spy/CpxP family protein refolding chaperone [Bryobacterales bacterium]|nr:Spy/CpxP family protein refolding chaperone [Bryobacterales bacterium]
MTAALGVTALAAQRHGGFEGKAFNADALKTAINLTDDQVTALKANNQAMREAMKAIMEQAHEKQQAIEAELENTNPNPTTVGQLMIDAKALRTQSSDLRAEYRTKALAVLNADQQAALTALVDSGERSPALREAGMFNLLEMDRGDFGSGDRGPRRGGFGGGR